MNTREVKLEVRRVYLLCDMPSCRGEMVFTGAVLMTSPPQYPHKCKKCGLEQVERRAYPTIDYVEDITKVTRSIERLQRIVGEMDDMPPRERLTVMACLSERYNSAGDRR